VHQTAGSDGSRRGRTARVSTSLAEINVVPLVDVMLVLLIIFMVTAPMIQRGVDVNLPVSTKSGQIVNERVFVSVPITFRQDRAVYLGDEKVRLDLLQERVRQKMETAAKKEVFLGGDRGVNLGELMEVFSMLKAAGVEKVSISEVMTRIRRDR